MEENLTQEQSLIKRIVICGPESTGKSSMTENPSVYFKTNYVNEFAREFLQKKWETINEVCTKEDLLKIAKGQIELENKRELENPEPEVVRFLDHLSLERRLSAHTLRNYKGALQKFALWLYHESKEKKINSNK